MEQVIVYTDGSCKKNGTLEAVGGLGVYFPDDATFGEYSQYSKPVILKEEWRDPVTKLRCTNNIAEMMAIYIAINIVNMVVGSDCPVNVRTDSMLCIRLLTGRYKIHKNKKIFTIIKNEINARKGKITFTHVKGHSGNKGNDIADKLANRGSALASKTASKTV